MGDNKAKNPGSVTLSEIKAADFICNVHLSCIQSLCGGFLVLEMGVCESMR